MWSWMRVRAAGASAALMASTMPRCSTRRRSEVVAQSALGPREVGTRLGLGQVGGDGRLEDQPRAHDVGDGEAASSDLQAHEDTHAAAGSCDDDGAGAR